MGAFRRTKESIHRPEPCTARPSRSQKDKAEAKAEAEAEKKRQITGPQPEGQKVLVPMLCVGTESSDAPRRSVAQTALPDVPPLSVGTRRHDLLADKQSFSCIVVQRRKGDAVLRKEWNSRHEVFICALAAFLVFLTGEQAQAKDEYPTKPITLVIPYSVGGGTDVQARLVNSFLEKKLGTPVVVENKAGGGGAIAHREVAHASSDGYKVLVTMFPDNAVQVAVKGKELGFSNEDFEVLATYTSTPGALAVKPDSPFKTMDSFVDYAKKNPGKLTVSVSSQTWLLHVFDIEEAFGIDLNPIMFKGGGDAVNALLGGHVMATMSGGHFVVPGPEKGFLPLVITGGTKRFEKWPNTPLMKELGKDVSYEMRRIFCVRKGTPEPIVKKLLDTFVEIGKDPEFIEKLKGMGEIYEPSYGKELQRYYAENCEKITKRVEKRKADFQE
jgi:tripartite-type tricarboxylate transporter receptor subunit TctC